MTPGPAVAARAVHKRYGAVRALGGVSLEVEEGEFFALLGPNGAGKTTLISALGGLAIPDAGTLAVMGHDVRTDYRAARRALGIVPQEIVFDPFFTVRETLEIQSGYFGLRANGKWIDQLLDRLGLAVKAHANMRSLSGGMKRRVMVAQALVHRPPVIVLDEPTAGVDVELRQALWSFVRSLNAAGHTIVLTTHYLEEAQQLCTRIAMMKDGRIVALDSTARLLAAFSQRVLRVKLAVGDLPPRPRRLGHPRRRGLVAHPGGRSRAHRGLARAPARGGRGDRGPRGRRARAGGGVREDHGRARGARAPVPAMSGFRTLLGKEVRRFWKVSFQTVAAPVLSALLYLWVFGQALTGRVEAFPGVSYLEFLIPGLAMMAMLQNAFANSSSSLIQSKVTGNIVFILLPPLAPVELFGAYLLAAVVRALVVGAGVFAASLWFVPTPLHHPLWALAFALVGSALLGVLGIIAGLWAEKFDQIAAFQNFVVLPLTFLAGVFYSMHSLPPFWRAVSRFNPFFYAVDGFRYGFFGQSDVAPWASLAFATAALAALSWLTLRLLARGWKLRH